MKKETLEQAQLLERREQGFRAMLKHIKERDSIRIHFNRSEVQFIGGDNLLFDEKFTRLIHKKLLNILRYQIKLSQTNFKKLK